MALDPKTLRAMAAELDVRFVAELALAANCRCGTPDRHATRGELLTLLAGSFRSHAIRIDQADKEADHAQD